MLFNSFSFLFFFPFVIVMFYSLPARFRIGFLLLASCYFYMVFVPKYILILFFLIISDYFLAKRIEKMEEDKRKAYLLISIFINLGTLFFFKYFNFFNENISEIARFIHWNYSPYFLSIVLPLGLSFHVFQSLSYVIEVYKGKYKAENNFFNYALYVMFFPQLVAGPIERPQHLLPQFNIVHEFSSVRARKGLERMLWGFFKKSVIADGIAGIINPVYSHLPSEGPSLLVLMFLFTYQLYCDFSGYSDIAIGSAMVLGFELTENFDRPFSSLSIAEFWRRWHISLSNWLRDYLYYPLALGWGKVSKSRLYFSLFITFVLIGLWHGSNWTFVVMGALHGFYMVFSSITVKYRERIRTAIGLEKFPQIKRFWQTVVVFILVSISFVFFRSENISQAWFFISHLTTNMTDLLSINYLKHSLFRGLGLWQIRTLVIILSILILELVQYYQIKTKSFYLFENKKLFKYAWYYGLVSCILIFGYFGQQAFIYFKF